SGGRSSQSIGVDAPAEHAPAALELLFATLLEPAFLAEEVERARDAILDELASRDDEPAERLAVAMAAAAFGRQPWGLDPLGNERSLRVVSPVTLRVAHERWLHPANLVVGVVGNVDVECVESRLRHVLGRLPARGRPLRPVALRLPARLRRVALRSGRGQAHVSLLYAGLRALDPRCAALDVLGAVLNGQAGRLFTRLREEAGLAYAVGASSVDGPFGGMLSCGLATDPARLDEAERRLLDAVASIRDGDISDEEVERARAACLGGAEAGLQTASARCMALTYAELYGLGGLRYRALSRRARGVTPEQVRRLAGAIFSLPLVYGRLGPEE
ncbi:MAG: insulinase family protein, partial [Deltaproteobacteria bacterium]|nr:insulinase family protein [Deltaproteobacteria bacterium]